MKTFFKILGIILLIAVSMFVGFVLYFRFGDKSGADEITTNVESGADEITTNVESGADEIITNVNGLWLLNNDLTAVKEDDKIKAQNYVVGYGSLYALLKVPDGEPVITEIENYIQNTQTYTTSIFGLLDGANNEVIATLSFESGMTWSEWCDSTFNNYNFAFVAGFLMLNAFSMLNAEVMGLA